MRDKRVSGLSQLDYLWTNYGGFNVSSVQTSNPEESIPSQQLVIDLLLKLGDTSVGAISLKGNDLVLYNQSGLELSRVDISELNSKSITITDFGLKLVSESDIALGCSFDLYTKVYYITLSDGISFWAKQDVLEGFESSTIKTLIIDNSIVSSLKVDSNAGNVILTTTNGLKATLPIQGLGEPIKFLFLTQEEYNNIVNPKTGTVYFIEGLPYFYFGSSKVGTVLDVDLFEIVDTLPSTGEKNKIYLIEVSEGMYQAYTYIDGVAISIGTVGDNQTLENRVDDIEQTLIWNEF